jgi:GMP synthase (glutamine-hydrolysing)
MSDTQARHGTILVIQHVEPETAGAIGPVLASAGLGTRTVRTYAGEPVPRTLSSAKGLVVMGGPMGVYEQARYPHLGDELALIENALSLDAPVLGVCLGSQLLASVLGARVYPGPAKELGWYPLAWQPDAERDPLFRATARRDVTAFHWHGDHFDPPAGTRILARSALTPVQAFAYEDRAYGILCHLEMTPLLLTAIVTTFADEARSAGHDPAAIIAQGDAFIPLLSAAAGPVFAGWATLAVGSGRHATPAS